MRGLTLIAGFAAALTLAGASPASSVTPLQKAALKTLAHARTSGRIDAATAAAARAEVNRAAFLARTLPAGRREHVTVPLTELVSFAGVMTQPRALTLIGELKANNAYFAKHFAPAPKTDITDADGIVYRYFAGRCFEFHPLANFGALNAHATAGDIEGTQQLADALIARGVYQHSGGIGWEYTFPFSGGRAPWLSGMAQAVAAQAFARAAGLVPAESASLMGKARAAYQAIPGRLLTSVAAGPWIRLYSFTSLPVLNAQLQAVLSLQSYAVAAEDEEAASLAARMQRAAAATLARFDTGYWSYYALPHDPSPLDYHEYVVQLLKRLAPTDKRFADAAVRFAQYETQPPAIQLAPSALGQLTFWVSKPSTVSVVTAAGRPRRVNLDGGWHTLSFGEPRRAGIYGVRGTATDASGNHTAFEALPFVRATSTIAAPKKRSTAGVRETAQTTAPPFYVGSGLDDATQSARAAQGGITLQRLTVTWPPGATAPDPAIAAGLQQLAPSATVLIELVAAPLPADDAGRAALSQYAAALAANVASLHSLVLEPAPTGASAAAYVAALGAVQSALPDARVGVALDGSAAPLQAAVALAGVETPVVVFRPAATPAKAVWTLADLARVQAAFPGAAIVVEGVPAPFASTIKTAACSPDVTAVLFDRLSDALRTGLRGTISTAGRGAFVCPGFTAEALPFTLELPDALTPAPLQVTLDCNRDCLYLVTLDDARGAPVVAKRGQLVGGVHSQGVPITLPKAKLAPGTYRVDVRLVARVNSGKVWRFLGPPLTR